MSRKRTSHCKTESVRVLAGDEEFSSKYVHDLYKWWLSYQTGLPSRGDFDIMDQPHLAPYVFVIDVLEPDRFQFKLRGHIADQILGGESKDLVISKTMATYTPLDNELMSLVDHYSAIVQEQQCRSCKGSLMGFKFVGVGFESIDCPIRDKNGTISHIIGAIDTEPSDLLSPYEAFL